MNPFATGVAQQKAGLVVGVLMFALTLSALNSIGLVPDYVDGTGSFAQGEGIAPVLEALPDERGQLALSDIPRLGDAPVLTPIIEKPVVAATPATTVLAPSTSTPAVDEKEVVLVATPAIPTAHTPLVLSPAALPPQEVVHPIETPTSLLIPTVGISVPILNPESTNVAQLDAELAKGVVRYSLSSQLNEDGNMFIFGHSSYLPVVKNKMYKALNGIEKLSRGDTILLTGKSGEVHEYQVTSVKKTDAGDELIDLSVHTGVRKLTLSTCDSFGKKSSRFVVEAEFVKIRK